MIGALAAWALWVLVRRLCDSLCKGDGVGCRSSKQTTECGGLTFRDFSFGKNNSPKCLGSGVAPCISQGWCEERTGDGSC